MTAEIHAIFYNQAGTGEELTAAVVDNPAFWQDWLIDRMPNKKERPDFAYAEMYAEGELVGTYAHVLDVAVSGVMQASAYAALHGERAAIRMHALGKFDATAWMDEGKRLIIEELERALSDAHMHAAVCLETLADWEGEAGENR